MSDDHTQAVSADAALISRIKNGDRRAAQWLVEQYSDRVYGYGLKLLRNPRDAEDLTQETFLRFWKNLNKWQPEAPVLHWLLRVAYNLAIDQIRRSRSVSIDQVAEPADPAQNQLDRVTSAELSAIVNSAIDRLPDRQRAAVIFSHQEGLSNIETAEVMNISVEAVESLLSRGRRRLKELLSDFRPEFREN